MKTINGYSIISLALLLLLNSCLNSDTVDSGALLKSELAAIDAYLASKNITPLKDASGVRFTIDSLASGYTPRLNYLVTFDYTGKLMDATGTVFQTSTLKNTDITKLIVGFQIALPLVPNGSKATFYIPASYGYGSQAQTNIPANSNLIFQIKLKNIVVTAAEKTRLAADTTIIANLLKTAAIANVVKDTSGLRYTIDAPGTGQKPTWLNKVKINYTGYLITAGAKGVQYTAGSYEPVTAFDSRVANYIWAFQLGLQQIKKGGKATLYVPSRLAFGSTGFTVGNVDVPPNSNLIFELELVDVFAP